MKFLGDLAFFLAFIETWLFVWKPKVKLRFCFFFWAAHC